MERNIRIKILVQTLMDIKNLSIVRQSFANAVFTHKVQEVAAEDQDRKVFWVKITNIVLVSVVLILLFLQASKPNFVLLSYMASGITIAEVIFLIIQLSFSFEKRAVMYKNSALKYMGLRDNYKVLIADIMNGNIPSDTMIAKRDLLQHEYQVISDLAPQTGSKEYAVAQKRLNKRGPIEREEFTWSDNEIDRFLPEKLRLGKYAK